MFDKTYLPDLVIIQIFYSTTNAGNERNQTIGWPERRHWITLVVITSLISNDLILTLKIEVTKTHFKRPRTINCVWSFVVWLFFLYSRTEIHSWNFRRISFFLRWRPTQLPITGHDTCSTPRLKEFRVPFENVFLDSAW